MRHRPRQAKASKRLCDLCRRLPVSSLQHSKFFSPRLLSLFSEYFQRYRPKTKAGRLARPSILRSSKPRRPSSDPEPRGATNGGFPGVREKNPKPYGLRRNCQDVAGAASRRVSPASPGLHEARRCAEDGVGTVHRRHGDAAVRQAGSLQGCGADLPSKRYRTERCFWRSWR